MTSNTEITAATTQPAIVAQPYLWTDPAKIPPRPWVYGTHLLRGSMSMLVGEGAVGKSSIVTGMALSLVTGKSLLGSKVHGSTPKRVWIINLEDSQHEIARSIQAAASHWNIKPDDMGDRLFVNAGVGSSFHMIKNSVHGVVPNDELVKAMVADRAGSVCLHRDRQRISGSSAGCFLELPIWAFMEGGRSPTGMKAHIGGQFHAATFTGRLSKYA